MFSEMAIKIAHCAMDVNFSSASFRLVKAEQSSGLAAQIFSCPRSYMWQWKIKALLRRIVNWNARHSQGLPWCSDPAVLYDLSRNLEQSDADIIHLHWVTTKCIDFTKLPSDRPVVWTLHDVWPLTGGCHCNLGCDKWKNGCTSCPQGTSRIPLNCGNAISPQSMWQYKMKVFSEMKNLTIVTPSKWLAEMVRQSPLFAGKECLSIPNCLDTEKFVPGNKMAARRSLDLADDKKYLLFNAAGGHKVKYKGFDILLQALAELNKINDENIELLIIGSDSFDESVPFPVKCMGRISDADKLINIYQAADLFVHPSQQDNYPNVLIEAMACGLPAVGFDVGGIPEIIIHRQTGYIAQNCNVLDFASGCSYCLKHSGRLSENARIFAENTVAEEKVVSQYSTLYENLIKKPGI